MRFPVTWPSCSVSDRNWPAAAAYHAPRADPHVRLQTGAPTTTSIAIFQINALHDERRKTERSRARLNTIGVLRN